MSTTAPHARRLASVAQAADYAAVSHWTIRRRINDGTLTGYRMGARIIRVDLDEVDAWMQVVPAAGALGGGRVV